MEFWGAEVKVGETVKVDPSEFEACIHLSQAALGESKKDKEPVVLSLKVGDQKFVLGTLNREKIPQVSLELVLDREFELSHNSKTASVHFCGYKAYYPADESEDDFSDSDESDEDIPLNAENGKPVIKAEELKVTGSKKADAKSGASAKQVKVIDPKKDEEDDSDDEDDEDDDSDEEMDDADSDSDESDSDDTDEETPVKKADQGKKRANDSALKTPVSTKKAKNITPEKTDGKKTGHTATPHPGKKGGKNSESKAQTPKSGGQFSCSPCSKSFNSESGFQQHKKAKHGGQ
ncbi:histone deacetylase HDT1-like [Lotus japonicus]|uniref:histone deacetylase HDT1-like n=1 Tax=Lotus japonicus TaxID=34305 RepID=UPI00258778DB|nr:histone deacetylase HDT1-like [Lotus japonicus]